MYDGDPQLILTEDGAEIFMENGNIFVSNVVHNAVLIAVFSGKDNDHHNVLFSSDKYSIESKTLDECSKPITIQSIKNIRKAIEFDLKPLVDDGLIYDLEIEVRNTTGKSIYIKIYYVFDGEQIQKQFEYSNGTLKVT